MEFRRVLFRSCQYLHREIAMTDNAGTGDAFRRRLATARDSRKISQGELAKKTGLPASSISHFEGGGRKQSFGNLLRLADAQIGRATGRERVWKYWEITGGAGYYKKKTQV